MYFFVVCSTWITKNLLIKPFYKLIRKTDVPVLTFGRRPSGASGCGKFIFDDTPSTTFGLPSNHSQIAWTVAVYILCKITIKWNNATKSTDTTTDTTLTVFGHLWMVISWFLVLGGAIYISYSRIYIENCNTLFQITASSVLGAVFGFLIYYFEDDAISFLKNKISVSSTVEPTVSLGV